MLAVPKNVVHVLTSIRTEWLTRRGRRAPIDTADQIRPRARRDRRQRQGVRR